MPTLKQLLEELRKIDVDPDEPPAPKRIEKTITNLPPKINRAPKGMKQRTSRPIRVSKRITAHGEPEYPGDPNRNVTFFNQPLNYHWGNIWSIRHSEIAYESEGEPL